MTNEHFRHTPFSRMLLGGFVGLAAASPILVGIISIRSAIFPYSAITAALLGVLAAWLPGSGRFRTAVQRLVMVLVAVSLSATAIDLGGRFLLARWAYTGAEARFLTQWPKMPLVHRFVPNRLDRGRRYGHLALGYPEYRVYREIRFETDGHGFRNSQSDPADIDVIVLGDSYGAGAATTQELGWGSVLASRYGLTVYNLSIAGSPWEEYINLAVELDRLDVDEETIVLWMIFTGNDLEGDYYPIYELSELPWNNWFEALAVSYQAFRFHSPIRLNLRRIYLASSTEDPVIVERLPDGRPFLFYAPYAERRDRSVDEVRQKNEFAALEETVAAMRRLADSKPIRVAVILAPSKEEVYAWLLDDGEPWSTSLEPSVFSLALQEVAQKEGLCFLDLKPALVEASQAVYEERGELLWWPDDTHWNPEGNAFVATTVFDSLCLDSAQPGACCE